MPPPAIDRQLRRLVADLVSMSEDDIDGILANLSDRHRNVVEVLISEYRGAASARHTSAPERWEDMGLSPWLVSRLARADAEAGPASETIALWSKYDLSFTMAPRARAALLSAGRRMVSRAAAPSDRAASNWLTGWLHPSASGARR